MFERSGPRPEVPTVVRTIAAGRAPVQVWHNELGGLTYRLDGSDDGSGDPGSSYVKWCPPHPEFDLEREAAKLTWAGRFVSVPRVLGVGTDATGSWLHTATVAGATAVAPWFVARPELAAAGIGRGLRLLHDRLPVADCPYDWSVGERLRLARSRGAGSDEARAALGDPPPIDRLVVCHGDACVPNTLLSPDGEVTGHVDLGSLGVADRWADLAVATYSLGWNFDGDWASTLLDAYGIDPDPVRTTYYRGLWDCT